MKTRYSEFDTEPRLIWIRLDDHCCTQFRFVYYGQVESNLICKTYDKYWNSSQHQLYEQLGDLIFEQVTAHTKQSKLEP